MIAKSMKKKKYQMLLINTLLLLSIINFKVVGGRVSWFIILKNIQNIWYYNYAYIIINVTDKNNEDDNHGILIKKGGRILLMSCKLETLY